ncbi:MAG: helix-turn-helix domain-containing protein [Burkholderiales bacterium]|nr:helix-turn-helix domain-containing protein [Phycisphaerae bacterium]
MATATAHRWQQGTDLKYVMPLPGERMLAISLPAAWLKAGRTGEPLLLPPAVRALDRLRALFLTEAPLTPGFILSLREALGLTQEAFGQKVGVSKMTVSRWECGRMAPGNVAAGLLRKLQARAQRDGVKIDGRKR